MKLIQIRICECRYRWFWVYRRHDRLARNWRRGYSTLSVGHGRCVDILASAYTFTNLTLNRKRLRQASKMPSKGLGISVLRCVQPYVSVGVGGSRGVLEDVAVRSQ